MEKKIATEKGTGSSNYEVPRVLEITPLHLLFQGTGSHQFDSLTNCTVGGDYPDEIGDCS